MEFLRRALRALVRRDNTTVPALCYAACNNAYLAAQNLGQNAALCAANSTFLTSFTDCQDCCLANGYTNATLQTYVEPEFAPFLNYCSAQSAQPEGGSGTPLTSIGTAGPTPITSSVNLAQSSSLASMLSQAKLSLMAEASSLGLVLGTTEQVTSTVFYTAKPSPSQNATSASATSSPPLTKSTSTNRAWIAGAVIGPLFFVALVILAFWLWRRRKRRTVVTAYRQQPDEENKEDMIKAQLHADSLQIQRHELEGHPTAELGDERVPELPALEPVGSELSAKKQVLVKRKPVGDVT